MTVTAGGLESLVGGSKFAPHGDEQKQMNVGVAMGLSQLVQTLTSTAAIQQSQSHVCFGGAAVGSGRAVPQLVLARARIAGRKEGEVESWTQFLPSFSSAPVAGALARTGVVRSCVEQLQRQPW